MPETSPRPTQVTIAAWLVMGASVFVVLTAFDQIAGLRSLETRETVEEFLSKPPGEELGLGVQGMLSVMRVLTMVTAACATAAAILGFQILRRSRSARLVLTVLAGPLFLAGTVVGGLLPAVIVGSILMLWLQPARDWIDGRTPRPVATPPTAESPPNAALPPPAPPAPVSSRPRAVPGFGAVPSQAPEAWRTIPPAYAAPPARPARPPALMWACGITWAGCTIAFMAMLASVALMLSAPDLLLDEAFRQNPGLRSDGVTPSELRSAMVVAGVLVMVWSAVASVLAGFAWGGRPWARTALVVSASSATMLCLLASLGNPAMAVTVLVCGVTVPLLLRPDVRAFMTHR